MLLSLLNRNYIMGHYEDFFWEITESLNNKGLREQFSNQLEKMRFQDKHKHKETKDRWNYAYNKVVKLFDKKANQ